jgi:hypothetical protein
MSTATLSTSSPNLDPPPRVRRRVYPTDEWGVRHDGRRYRGFMTYEEAEDFAALRPGAQVFQVSGPAVDVGRIAGAVGPLPLPTPEAAVPATPKEPVAVVADDRAGFHAPSEKGTSERNRIQRCLAKILPTDPPGITKAEIQESTEWGQTGIRNQDLTDALRAGFDAEEFGRSGEGKRGDPFRYFGRRPHDPTRHETPALRFLFPPFPKAGAETNFNSVPALFGPLHGERERNRNRPRERQ